jgi:tripartite-type tricarboxylate transporter receptor subunit TctC
MMIRLISTITLSLACLLGVHVGHAQDYPNRPIRLIVPAGAGGPTDILARLMGDFLSQRFGQPVVIDNRPGAGTNIGTQAVINAEPDGYTLLVTTHANAINPTLYRNLQFNFLKQMVLIASIAQVPNFVEVTPSLPVKTISELIAHAKANPGKINFASTGHGTSAHLAGELFKSLAKIDIVHVPYRSSGPALTDLMSGQVQLMFDSMPASLPHVKAGKLRALAVTSAQRVDALPDVPTVSETVPGYVISGWFGVGAPAGTPQAIVDRLNREVTAGLENPKIRARLADLSATPHVVTPAEYRKFVEAETEKWGKIVKASGATID